MTQLDRARQIYREAKAEATRAIAQVDSYRAALREAENVADGAESKARAAKQEVWAAMLAEDGPA